MTMVNPSPISPIRLRVAYKTAQALARHSTITLTMDRYSHSLIGEQAEALDVLLGQSDYVSLHVPLTRRTRHMLDAPALAVMRPHSLLINVARGEIVDVN